MTNSWSEAFSRIERKYFQAFVQRYKRRLRPITSAEAMPDSINENVDGSGTTDDVTMGMNLRWLWEPMDSAVIMVIQAFCA